MKRERSRHGYANNSTSRERKPPTFFKLILTPTSLSTKLRIPEEFATTFSDELSAAATLMVPTGVSRRVALVEEDFNLWFHDGWEEFVKFFSIGCAYFLLFTYEGNLSFKVQIFDPTGCEISYPCNSCSSSNVQNEHNCGKLSAGVSHKKEINGDANSSDVDAIQLDNVDEDYVSDERETSPLEGSKHINRQNDAKHAAPSVLPIWLRKSEELMKAVAATGISMPENPFFVASVKRSSFKAQYMTVPIDFAREHLDCWDVKSAKLEAPDGRQWLVQVYRGCGRCNLGIGWLTFAQRNGLAVGDVCLFEITDVKDHVLKVHIAKTFQITAAGKIS